MACLLYGLDLLGHHRGQAWIAPLVIMVGIAAAFALLHHSKKQRHSLLDVSLLQIPTFSVATLGGSFTRIALNGTPFLLPLMFQLGFGMNPFDAGLLVFFYMLGNLVMKVITTPIMQRFGFRTILLANGAMLSASIAAFTTLSPAMPVAIIALVLLIGGMVRSLQFASLNTLAFADVPDHQRPQATMLASAMQHLSNSLAVGVAALALNISTYLVDGQSHHLDSFAVAFGVLAAAGVAAMPFFWRLAKDAGAEVSRRYP
jgi:MFS family permease